jgi:hypothetical protein
MSKEIDSDNSNDISPSLPLTLTEFDSKVIVTPSGIVIGFLATLDI